MSVVRIKDVAAHAGVSVATITRVINETGYVSAATREKVQQSIKELGYIPNRMASALKNNSTRIIRNLVPAIDINPFFTSVGASISHYAQEHDYRILTIATQGNARVETSLINDLIGRMVEGIIFTGDMLSKPENIQAVLNKGIPIIMIERPLDVYGVDKVLINDLEGSSLAARRFLASGHRRVGFIGVDRPNRVDINRYEGFRMTMARNGVVLRPRDHFRVEDYKAPLGYHAMKTLIGRYSHRADIPGAFFFASDILACGALQYLYEIGLRVPDDISVIGYDNTLSAMTAPPLSSIAFPIEEIGKTVMRLFLERREGGRTYAQSVELCPFFADRGSVRSL